MLVSASLRLAENKVYVHTLFYFTGIGITILLMNLLIAVLGQNFELYQDQSEVLFLRARAKMMLELSGRPWRHIANCFFKLVRCRKTENRRRYDLIFFLLIPLLPILIPIGLIFQMQPSGMAHTVSVAFGQCDPYSVPRGTAERCGIWMVVRQDRSMEDLRSLRTEVKDQVGKLEMFGRIC